MDAGWSRVPAFVMPRGRTGAERFVPLLVAPMVFLAVLAAGIARHADRTAAAWQAGLAGSLTIQVPPDEAGAGAADIAALVEVLGRFPGIAEARALDQAELAGLLEPWLGPDLAAADLPLPALIAATIDPAAPPDRAALEFLLRRSAPGATIEDHQLWLGDAVRLARRTRGLALALVGLVGLAAVATVIFATRVSLAIHRPVIELLHLMGAEDIAVARFFQRQGLALAGAGAALGAALAAAALYLLQDPQGGSGGGFLGLPRWTLADALWLAAIPLGLALLSALTARLIVLRRLAQMP